MLKSILRGALVLTALALTGQPSMAADNPPFPATAALYRARGYAIMPAQAAVLIESAMGKLYAGDLIGFAAAAGACKAPEAAAYRALGQEFSDLVELALKDIKDDVVRHYKKLEIEANSKTVTDLLKGNCGNIDRVSSGIYFDGGPYWTRTHLADLVAFYFDLRKFVGESEAAKMRLIVGTREAEEAYRRAAPIITAIEQRVTGLGMPEKKAPLGDVEAKERAEAALSAVGVDRARALDCMVAAVSHDLEHKAGLSEQRKPKSFRDFKILTRQDVIGRKIVGLLAVFQDRYSVDSWELHGRKTGDGVLDPTTFYDVCWIDQAASSIKAHSYYVRYEGPNARLIDYVVLGR